MTTNAEEPAFMALAVDAVYQCVVIVGFAQSDEECRKTRSRTNLPYFESFCIADGMAARIHSWLTSCGLTQSDATTAVKNVCKTMIDIIDGKAGVNILDRDDS